MIQIKIDNLYFRKKSYINKQIFLYEDKEERELNSSETLYFIIKEVDFEIIRKDIIIDENGDDQLLFFQLTSNETNLESAKYKIEFWLKDSEKDIFVSEKDIYFE